MTPNQKRVMLAFERTGVAAQRSLEKIPYWKRSLASLIHRGLITQLGDCWMLTKEGGNAMPEVVEDNVEQA
jgi:hypothetical protein